jgi:hypothetical protein
MQKRCEMPTWSEPILRIDLVKTWFSGSFVAADDVAQIRACTLCETHSRYTKQQAH